MPHLIRAWQQLFGVPEMAKNTGKGHRVGAVDGRSQFQHPVTGTWFKRDRETGRIMDGKADHRPFKGVAREPDQRQDKGRPEPS